MDGSFSPPFSEECPILAEKHVIGTARIVEEISRESIERLQRSRPCSDLPRWPLILRWCFPLDTTSDNCDCLLDGVPDARFLFVGQLRFFSGGESQNGLQSAFDSPCCRRSHSLQPSNRCHTSPNPLHIVTTDVQVHESEPPLLHSRLHSRHQLFRFVLGFCPLLAGVPPFLKRRFCS
jgi:hypothetical protein